MMSVSGRTEIMLAASTCGNAGLMENTCGSNVFHNPWITPCVGRSYPHYHKTTTKEANIYITIIIAIESEIV